jgi:hypothetical protein
MSEAQAKASRVEALEALLAAERERVNDLRAERERWALIAEASQQQVTQLRDCQESTAVFGGLLGWIV